MANSDRLNGWQLDDAGAAAFERDLVPRFSDPWAADLVERLAAEPGEQVLDLGCGTGAVARHASPRVGPDGAVIAVDVSPAMVAAARQATAHLDNVTVKEASAVDLPFPDATFDVVACQQTLQFVPNRQAAIAEIARVTNSGGRIGISTCRSLEHQPGYRAIRDVLTRHAGLPAGEVIASPYGLGDPEPLRSLLTDARLRDIHLNIAVWSIRFDSAQHALRAETSGSPLGDLVDELDLDVREQLVAELIEALRPHTDDDGVVFPFETLVVTAMR